MAAPRKIEPSGVRQARKEMAAIRTTLAGEDFMMTGGVMTYLTL